MFREKSLDYSSFQFISTEPRMTKIPVKSRILEPTHVFDEKGYGQAAMDDFAKKIGVSKEALYLCFASEEELFEKICNTDPVGLQGNPLFFVQGTRPPFQHA